MKKQEIKNILVTFLIDEEYFDESASALIVEEKSVNLLEKELEYKFKLEEKKLELEREREEKRLLAEREEREREREAKERENERVFQLRLKELEIQGQASSSVSRQSCFDVTKHIRLVPPFQEKEVDQYFLHFEKVAQNLKWPKDHWTLLLQSTLIGKAREIYTQLSVEQSSDYDYVKQTILNGYELVPEAYRQKFRNCKKDDSQTHVEFARIKEQLFDRWCSSKKIGESHDKLRQLMLVEEFKCCIRTDVKTFLDEKQVDSLDEAARLADDYALTHKTTFGNKPYSNKPQSQNKSNSANFNSSNSQSESTNRSSATKDQNPLSQVTCNYCKKPGHLISNCYKLRNKNQRGETKPTGLTTLWSKPQSDVPQHKVVDVVKPKSNSVMEVYEPFLSEGFVSLSSDLCPPTPVKILRDTGAAQSLILADTLPFSDNSYSGTSVLIQGVECGSLNVPLHNIQLKSDVISGPVSVGIRPSLPFPGVHLLLGNDLAGDKVVVNPLVTDTPLMDSVPDACEQEFPELYPSCVVTRAMAKTATLNSSNDEVDLSETNLGQIFNDQVNNTSFDSLLSKQTLKNDFKSQSSPIDQGHDNKSRSQLVHEQQNDPEISDLRHKALDSEEALRVPVCYYLKDGVLLRKWRPVDVPANEEWQVKHQIVVPKSYRPEILNIAHETPLAGHLGINKTYEKILNHFYWPGLKADVAQFCKSCHTCQMVGKPNQSIPKSPLQPIPAIEEPFSRIIIDCVDYLKPGNLEKIQSKMKERYDIKTENRTFDPGDSVLVLLPIPGSPLQARYFGPYVVDKKVSDLNYIINTPGRRKQKQMCHVNMLKKYVDRDSSFVKPVSVINTVPQEISNSDSNCITDICENNDPGPVKLTNSEILQHLDQKLSHLDRGERDELEKLLHEYEHLFPDVPTRTDKIYHDVVLEDCKPIKQHPYRMNPVKKQILKDEVKYLLDNDLIEPSQSNFSSPCILVPKSNGTYRMCTDYRRVNIMTRTDSYPIPRIDDCIDKVGKARYVTKFDLLKGFWQVPLTERAKEVSAFVTPNGLYQYKVMPFGMKNSPATFQRLINTILAGLECCEAYIDDVIIYSDNFKDHLQTIRAFFDRLSDAKLTINLEKSEFCHSTLTFLGHVVGQGHIKPVDAKVKAISEFPEPICKRQLMRFLGMAGYYRKFCSNFSVIAEPLTNLLRKGVKFVWNEKCQNAFDKLKAILKSTPVLLAPDFDKSFKVAVDASDIGVGAVLIQEDNNGVDHPVCYFSKKFNKQQRNYSTIEKECLALILAIQHFEVYLTSCKSQIVVFSDHNPLSFLHKLKNKNQRLLRWSLMLQEYNLDVKHIKGRDNIIPDALSRV